jgi:hypothetical protein
MNTALKQPAFGEPAWGRALVLSFDAEGHYWLRGETQRLKATVAASCLLRPEPGDTALFFSDEAGPAYILAILERAPGAAAASLGLPPQTVIRADDLSLETGRLTAATSEMDFAAGRAQFSGGFLTLNFTVLYFAARQLTSVIRNIVQRCRNLNIEARETGRLTAGRLRLSAREGLSAKAEGVDIKAENAVKVNGRSIQLG